MTMGANPDVLMALADRCEASPGPDREINRDIEEALWPMVGRRWSQDPGIPRFTGSLDKARSISDAMCVFASDIGADGLPCVRLVMDTSTSPIVEYVGIAATLELAWCAASLRAKASVVSENVEKA